MVCARSVVTFVEELHVGAPTVGQRGLSVGLAHGEPQRTLQLQRQHRLVGHEGGDVCEGGNRGGSEKIEDRGRSE